MRRQLADGKLIRFTSGGKTLPSIASIFAQIFLRRYLQM